MFKNIRFDNKNKNKSKSLNVMFADFCYFNKNTLHARFVPLGIGMIAQYAKQKFKQPLHNLKMPKRSIKFLSDISRNKMINGVKEKLSSSPDKDLYTAALDFVTPRSHLLHVLAYDENQKISLKSQ